MIRSRTVNARGDTVNNVFLKTGKDVMGKLEITKRDIQRCPCCGRPVVVRGDTTKYYEPVEDDHAK